MAPTFDGAAFFEAILPAVLLDKGAAANAVDGVLQFHLVLDEDHRSWFVDLTGARNPQVIEGEHPRPDVSITIDEPLVGPMLLGDLDVEAALDRGDVEVHGNAEVLERWTHLLSGAFSGASARIGAEQFRRGDVE